MNLELKAVKRPQGSDVQIIVNLSFERDGKRLATSISGKGKNLALAAANTVRDTKLASALQQLILRELSETSPKAQQPLPQPAVSGGTQTKAAGTANHSSGSPVVQSSQRTRTSTPQNSSSIPNQTSERSMRSSETPDGTALDSRSTGQSSEEF